MKQYKGKVGSVNIHDNGNVTLTQPLLKEELNILDIESIKFKEPTKMFNGDITLKTKKNIFTISFSKNQIEEFKELYDYVYKNSKASLFINTYMISYNGGHPLMINDGKSRIVINSRSISFLVGQTWSPVIDYNDITSIQLETQENMSSRFTATRIALLGPFALAFKKKSKSTEKYLTIDFTDKTKIESTMVFSGNLITAAYSEIYKAYSEYISKHEEDIPPMENDNAFQELKQLKELLDMEIITQDEFNAKKKQLLGL